MLKALRLVVTRRWLVALLASAVFAVTAYKLGWWQWHRYEAKAQRNARLDAHYHAAPVPVLDVVNTSPMPIGTEWTRITASGIYAGDEQLYVRNRPWNGTYGYEVLVPLVLADGDRLLVDRGWVDNSDQGAAVLPKVPGAPDGPVTVIGWVRQGEVSLHRHELKGQLASINLAEAARQTGGPMLGAYVELQSEQTATGASPPRPTALVAPDRDLGPHQAYAFQWWGGMPVGFALVFFGIRREVFEGDPTRPPKVKKVRIWDEEDA